MVAFSANQGGSKPRKQRQIRQNRQTSNLEAAKNAAEGSAALLRLVTQPCGPAMSPTPIRSMLVPRMTEAATRVQGRHGRIVAIRFLERMSLCQG